MIKLANETLVLLDLILGLSMILHWYSIKHININIIAAISWPLPLTLFLPRLLLVQLGEI